MKPGPATEPLPSPLVVLALASYDDARPVAWTAGALMAEARARRGARQPDAASAAALVGQKADGRVTADVGGSAQRGGAGEAIARMRSPSAGTRSSSSS